MDSVTDPGKKQNSKYEALLAAARDYVTVMPVDTPKTIYLVDKAKGNRAYRDFAAAIDTSIAFVSYVLNAQSVKIRNKVIAGIIDAAAAGSGVTLETLMEAQGRIYKKDLDSFEPNYQGEIRQILINELLEAGYEIKFSEYYKAEPDPTNSSFVLELKQPDTDSFVSCDFKIKACPLVKDTDDIDALISSWLDKTISVNFFHKTRLFLAVDNSTVYREIQKKLKISAFRMISRSFWSPRRSVR